MASCHIPVKQFPIVDFFFIACFFQSCPYSVFSARSQNTPDKTEAPTSILIFEANSPPWVSSWEQNMESWHGGLYVANCIFQNCGFFWKQHFPSRGGRFAHFYCSSPQKQLWWELGMLPERSQAVLSREQCWLCSWGQPGWLQWQDPPPCRRSRMCLAGCSGWMCVSGLGRCTSKLSNWFKNICWVIERKSTQVLKVVSNATASYFWVTVLSALSLSLFSWGKWLAVTVLRRQDWTCRGFAGRSWKWAPEPGQPHCSCWAPKGVFVTSPSSAGARGSMGRTSSSIWGNQGIWKFQITSVFFAWDHSWKPNNNLLLIICTFRIVL